MLQKKTLVNTLLGATCAALAILIILFCCSCSATGKNNKKDELNVCEKGEPQSLDPGLCMTVQGSTIMYHMFEGLGRWTQDSKGTAEVTASLAQELSDPVANADGTYTYTYKLKDNIKWSDGKEVTAKDFVFG